MNDAIDPATYDCPLPTEQDPLDPHFRMTLAAADDVLHIDHAHVVLRRDVLEVRRCASGRAFYQCRHCNHLPRTGRPAMSAVAPRHMGEAYRAAACVAAHHVHSNQNVWILLWIMLM